MAHLYGRETPLAHAAQFCDTDDWLRAVSHRLTIDMRWSALLPETLPSDEDLNEILEAQMNIAVSPLAIPILAGPGTIATAMNFSASASHLKVAITIAAFALLCVITYVFFVSGQAFIKYLGEGFIKVISRLMGLILAVIGTQMLISGIYGAISAYK